MLLDDELQRQRAEEHLRWRQEARMLLPELCERVFALRQARCITVEEQAALEGLLGRVMAAVSTLQANTPSDFFMERHNVDRLMTEITTFEEWG